MKQIVFTANPKQQIYLSIIQLYIFSSVTLIFQYTVYILQTITHHIFVVATLAQSTRGQQIILYFQSALTHLHAGIKRTK